MSHQHNVERVCEAAPRRRYLALYLFIGLWLFVLAMPNCAPNEPPTNAEKTGKETTKDAGVAKESPTVDQAEETSSPPDNGEPTLVDNGQQDVLAPRDRTPQEPAFPEVKPPEKRTTPEKIREQEPRETGTPDKPPPPQRIELKATKIASASGTLLVSNGIPMGMGVLASTNQLRLMDNGKEISISATILARWQDGSARSILLQFERDAAAFPATLYLELGISRKAPDRAKVPVKWTLPQAVAFPSPVYMSKTLALGRFIPLNADKQFAKYDQNAVTFYNQLKGDKDWNKDARRDGYYSTTLTWYMLFLRSGDVERYRWARREAVHYREDQIIKTGNRAGTMNSRNEPRYLYLQAMELDYLLNGDDTTKQVAGLMAKYLQGLHPTSWYHYRKSDTRFWTERRAAFPLLGLTVYGRWTGDKASLQAAKQILDKILDTQKEWPDGGWFHSLYAHDSSECSDRSAYGGSPFMTGLLFEALIQYYLWTKDPRIPPAIKKATDWLWTKGWKNDGFTYMIGCGTRYTKGVPDLNLLIAHGFGFVYWVDGKKAAAKKRANDVFTQGVTNAFLKTRKHYNQNYRSSHTYLWFLTQ